MLLLSSEITLVIVRNQSLRTEIIPVIKFQTSFCKNFWKNKFICSYVCREDLQCSKYRWKFCSLLCFSYYISLIRNLYFTSHSFRFYHFQKWCHKKKTPKRKKELFSSLLFSPPFPPPEIAVVWPVTSLPDCCQGYIKATIFTWKWWKEILQKRTKATRIHLCIATSVKYWIREWQIFTWIFTFHKLHILFFDGSGTQIDCCGMARFLLFSKSSCQHRSRPWELSSQQERRWSSAFKK